MLSLGHMGLFQSFFSIVMTYFLGSVSALSVSLAELVSMLWKVLH